MAAASPPCGLTRERLDEKKWVDVNQKCTAVVMVAGAPQPCGRYYTEHQSASSQTTLNIGQNETSCRGCVAANSSTPCQLRRSDFSRVTTECAACHHPTASHGTDAVIYTTLPPDHVIVPQRVLLQFASPRTYAEEWRLATPGRAAIASWIPEASQGLDFGNPPLPGEPESAYQDHFRTVVQRLEGEIGENFDVKAHDTHQIPTIDSFKPDYITSPRGFGIHESSINVIFEIKPHAVVFTNSMRGQVLGYCQRLVAKPPGRAFVTAVLTDCYHVQFIRVQHLPPRDNTPVTTLFRVDFTNPYALDRADGGGNRMLRTVLSTCYHLHSFRIDNVSANEALFRNHKTYVFGVDGQPNQVLKMRIELGESVLHEASILQRLADVAGVTHLVAPGYNHSAVCPRELLLTPRALSSVALADLPVTSAAISGIVSVLRDIHALGVYHRDVRPTNLLILPNLTIILCDFDHAIHRGSADNTPTEMAGAQRMYWSDEMHQLDEQYARRFRFTAAHDLHIFIRGLRCLFLTDNQLNSILNAADRATRANFWTEQFSSAPWPEIIAAIDHANGPQYDRIRDLIATLPNPPLRDFSGASAGPPAIAPAAEAAAGEERMVIEPRRANVREGLQHRRQLRSQQYSDVYMPLIAEAFHEHGQIQDDIYAQTQQRWGSVQHEAKDAIIELIQNALNTGQYLIAGIMTQQQTDELTAWRSGTAADHYLSAGVQDIIMSAAYPLIETVRDAMREMVDFPASANRRPRRGIRRRRAEAEPADAPAAAFARRDEAAEFMMEEERAEDNG